MRYSSNEDHLDSALWTKCHRRRVSIHGAVVFDSQIYTQVGLTTVEGTNREFVACDAVVQGARARISYTPRGRKNE